MPTMLHERLRGDSADQLAAGGIVPSRGIEILVHAVVVRQPVALADVPREHVELRRLRGGNVDDRLRRDIVPQRVHPTDRIAVVQVREARVGRHRNRRRAANRIKEAGRARNERDMLMVEHVVADRVREDESRIEVTHQVDGLTHGIGVVKDVPVGLVEAVLARVDQVCRRGRFQAANPRDLFAIQRCRPAATLADGRDVNRPTESREPHQFAGAEDLDIVKVCEQTQGDRAHRAPPSRTKRSSPTNLIGVTNTIDSELAKTVGNRPRAGGEVTLNLW